MERIKTLQELFKRYRRPGDFVFAGLFLAFSVFLLSQLGSQTSWTPRTKLFAQPAFWPAVSLAAMAVFAALHFVSSAVSPRIPGRWMEVWQWIRSFEYAAWFMAYVLAVPIAGYLLSTVVFMTLLGIRAGYRSRTILLSLPLVAIAIVVTFKTFLQVKVPGGEIYMALPEGLRAFMLTYFQAPPMETLLSGMQLLMNWPILIALLIGSVGGVIIGAIPGVGAAVAIAILLPATFALPPLVGLTMLLGIYGSSMYGGALPAVLINTPGTAVNALTTYDGYPMTQRGEARRAVALAYSASFFGGIFAIVCLIVLSPLLAWIAPQFGSREIFLAALLGIILVILAHRGQVFAAGMLAAFGIFLNTVGLEAVKYTRRFTFDQTFLASGIDLIVVVLGLFALSQAFFLLVAKDETPHPQPLHGSMFSGLKELWLYKRVATVASGFGVMMGMIPGVGEFTAQFMSYTYAQKTSKTPDAFGKGSPEGLIASEAANNAVPAAAMIPLLALGIPGEALTAMMLSVFYVHNVIPGPQLFQNDMPFVMALYMALLILNLVVIVFLMFSTNWLTKIIQLPTRFLGIVILTLSFVGVYSLRNSAMDCILASCFGVLGLILKRLNLPIVPIVLGMVLGGIMETKLRSAMARVKTPLDFIDRPIAAILFALILLVIALHIRTTIREHRNPPRSVDHDIHPTQGG